MNVRRGPKTEAPPNGEGWLGYRVTVSYVWWFSPPRNQQSSYNMLDPHTLLQQIQALPPERIAEIEECVVFIAAREGARSVARAGAAASAPAVAAVWDNPDDAA